MALRACSIAIISASFFSLVACNDIDGSAPGVNLEGETLVGEYVSDGEIAVFRGIPFAEPPVGELRWERPVPLVSKIAERDATSFAPACMQSMRILDWYRDLAETFGATRDVFDDLEISEDCLYLNVWTPKVDSNASLPVMVYIHGGSNNSGWAYEPNYHGHALADHGVVVVSVAYRVGVFGFLSHPDLGTANFGLWDQIASLEWIQENISKFGGDPDRVTVFGESAGAQDILALMTSNRADGLYHGAIMQSNAGFGLGRRAPSSLEDEQRRGMETAKIFGFEGDDTLRRLRSVPAAELLQKYEERFPRYYHAPATDGKLLTKGIWEVINDDELSPVPLIIGSNADEQYNSANADATRADIEEAISASLYLNSPGALATVIEDPDPANALDRIGTAGRMLCPSQYLAAHQTALNDNAWVYYFSRVREGEAGAEVRAYHGVELPYAFGTHDPWMTTTEVDWQLAEKMMGYWVQFAKTGNPNARGLPDWPRFDEPDGQTMEFSDIAAAGPAQEPVLCRIFRESITDIAPTGR